MRAGSTGAACSRHKLPWDKRSSFCHVRQLIIKVICFMCVLMPRCTCDSLRGFTVPKFQSLTDFSYKSPSDSNGKTPEISDNRLLLTPDPIETITTRELHYVGRIVYNQALQFVPSDGGSKEVNSFQSSLTFSIQTTSSYGKCGDGLAFFITSDFEPPPNSTGRYLGLQSQLRSSKGGGHSAASPSSSAGRFFAVEFDTFQNPDLNDPSASHIGIDISSLNSSAYLDTSGNNTCCREDTQNPEDFSVCPYCNETNDNKLGSQDPHSNKASANFVKSFYPELFLYNNYTFTAWIEYDAPTHLIQLWMTNRSTDQRPPQPCLSMTYNLSEIFLPQMYIGLSATSGNNFEGTIVYSWNFTILGKEKENVRKRMMIPIVVTAVAMLTIGVVVCILAAVQKRKTMRRQVRLGRRLERLPHLEMSSISIPRYTYGSLERAAQKFNNRRKVGEGGFSSVYRGVLKDGRQVAVKRFKDGVRMEAEFASEVQIISQIRHRNLLQLQGWCYEKGEALLVYQFMPSGSLDSYLFGSKRDSHGLDSENRLKILIGVAAALEYLHGGLGECVLHRDVKAANVLLTDKFEAMLGDFGLARLINHDQVVTMTAAGTPGYVAPELIYTGRATDKADVYGFGVLSLEVACGRRILDPSFEGRLSDWVWSLHQNGDIMNALDPRLKLTFQCTTSKENDKDEREGSKPLTDGIIMQEASIEFRWRCVLHLGLLCCQPCPDARPNMRQVHQALQENTLLSLPPLRPIYAPSFDLSKFSSCTLSLGNSGPVMSEQSISSPSNEKLISTLDVLVPERA